MHEPPTLPGAVILFDGVCNLCNGMVRFVMKRDARRHFRFASLQSSFGTEVLRRHGLSVDDLTSVLLLENGVLHTKSSAVLRIARRLCWPWPLLSGLRVVPSGARDALYDWVARNRYRWFGKSERCMLPSPDDAGRFVG